MKENVMKLFSYLCFTCDFYQGFTDQLNLYIPQNLDQMHFSICKLSEAIIVQLTSAYTEP